MNRLKLVFIITFFCSTQVWAGVGDIAKRKKKIESVDSTKIGVDYLRQYLLERDGWYVPGEHLRKSMQGIVSHFESGPLDSLVNNVQYYNQFRNLLWVDRRVQDIPNFDSIPGVMPTTVLEERLRRIDRAVKSSINKEAIKVPSELFVGAATNAKIIAEGDEETLYSKRKRPEFISVNVTDSVWQTLSDSMKKVHMHEARKAYTDSLMRAYNDSIIMAYHDSITNVYREKYVQAYSDSIQIYFKDSIDRHNFKVAREWNDSLVVSANEHIAKYLDYLSTKAANDSVDVRMANTDGRVTTMRLKNGKHYYNRIWIKNEQQDSLSVRIENIDRRTMKLLIDDGVTISRYKKRQTKEFELAYEGPKKSLRKVNKNVNVYSPWVLKGDGTVGFTQTHIGSYWKAGGNSATSVLFVLKGSALYKRDKINWESSGELRSGWAFLGGDEDTENKTRKNDDKLYLASRLGVSAFKKWFYSAEASFETQFFNGYKYSTPKKLISSFMAPGTFKFKIGMDYKPHKNLSVFVSPLTLKTVWVTDDEVDKTSYGIEKESTDNHFTVPGINFDVSWKKEIIPEVTYRTKTRMFFDYTDPIKKKEVWWENNIVMQLTQRLNMRFETYLKYDQNQKFDVEYIDENGEEQTRKEAKWQFKELFNIGFTYKINKRVYKRNVKVPM